MGFGVIYLKKRFGAFLLIALITLSYSVTVMASEAAVVAEPVKVEATQDITPLVEQTQIVWRTYHGVLQWRVWSLTWGVWLTDWAPA